MQKAFISILIFYFLSTVSAAPNALPVNGATSIPKNGADSAAKLSLVKELLILQEFNLLVDGGIKGAESFLSRPQKDSLAQKAYTDAHAKFTLEKDRIRKDVTETMEKELLQQFSLAELKYIVDFSKYPLYKKYRMFMESEKYYGTLGKPLKEARTLAEELKKKYGVKEELKVAPGVAPKGASAPIKK
jgi:hypothetical protein